MAFFSAAIFNSAAVIADELASLSPEVEVQAVEPATAHDIHRWIKELGDDAYSVRRDAAEQLLAVGAPAREPLLTVIDQPDPELRAAVRRLMVLIERAEFDRRLEAFASDKNGRQGFSLPGWESFRDLVGDDSQARALFVDMQRHEGPLLEKVFSASPDEQPLRWEERLLHLPPWQIATRSGIAARPVGSSAALLLLGSVPEGRVTDRGVMMLQQLVQQSPLREAIQPGGDHRDALRRLLVGWVTHCPNKSPGSLKFRLDAASNYELREALPLPLAVAQGDPQYLSVQPALRGYALLIVAQLGGAEHVGELERLLNDDTICLRVRSGRAVHGEHPITVTTIEVRDVALVTMLHLTGQNPAAYGFVNAARQDNRLFNLGTLHLENDEQRQAAMERWREWKSRQSRADRGELADREAKASS
jgi:hypothetical protein